MFIKNLRHVALIGIGSLLALTACSDSTTDDASADKDSPVTGETTSDGDSAEGGPAEYPLTITHAAGETVLEAEPQKIVVLDMGALDTIHELGEGNAIVGLPVQSIPSYLEADYAGDMTDVGTLKEPNLEEIVLLDPDLIIIGGRTAELYEELAGIAPTIHVQAHAPTTDYIGDTLDSARNLSTIWGKQDVVGERTGEINELAGEISSKIDDGSTAMFLLTNAGDVSMYGKGSRFGMVFERFGFAEAMPAQDSEATHGEQISFEAIKEANPDYLFVLDRDSAVGSGDENANAKVTLDNNLVAETTAWTEDQVVYVDPERWYIVGQGLGNIHAMLDEVNEALGE